MTNQKASSLTNVLRRKKNHNSFKKIINRQKDANNEAEYEESSVTYEVPCYFNIFKCGRNILNRHDVTYKRAGIATRKGEYYTDLLETIIEHNDGSKTPLSKEKFNNKSTR